jgi:hypothetical protein
MHVRLRLPLLAALLVSFALPGNATMLRQMSLRDLATQADKVFRGVVVGIDSTTVRAGGSDLPVMVYRLKVLEEFKGTFDAPKGTPVIELRMLGIAKSAPQAGRDKKLFALQDLPQLVMGQDYVLFTTRPSAIGLSTTVGLGQGAFTIQSGTKEEMVANRFGNAGLDTGRAPAAGLPRSGPIPYAQLARAIREVTGGPR